MPNKVKKSNYNSLMVIFLHKLKKNIIINNIDINENVIGDHEKLTFIINSLIFYLDNNLEKCKQIDLKAMKAKQTSNKDADY